VSDERDAVFEEAIAAMWTIDHGRALDLLSQAEALGHPDAPFEKACFLRALGRYAEAEVAFRSAIDGGDQDADVTLANMLADDLDRPDEAIAIYRAAIDRGVDVARRNLASTLIDLGRPGEAVKLLCDPPSTTAEALITLGFALEKEGRLTDALAVYERAAEDSPSADSSRAAVLHELGDFDAAVTAYRRAIERGDPDAPTYLGYLYSSHNDPQAAERVYQAALEDGNHQVLLNYGNLLADIPGREDEATDLYRQAIATGERDAHLNLAMHFDDLGLPAEAEEQFLRAIEVGDRTARAPYESFRRRQARAN
jgi:tetratricopeptide (TPR) repeat protein